MALNPRHPVAQVPRQAMGVAVQAARRRANGTEIMEISEAYALTVPVWSSAELAGFDAKTVARYVTVWHSGGSAGVGGLAVR